ncbi:hypothetical protein [Nonomuraea candida]|uniref:hypothetical protein n=1 Tax=Nonomuraea candida TaxID=359159 RepID=UPI0005BBFB99|nr:hypothetical protein [Nonomuraea candida]
MRHVRGARSGHGYAAADQAADSGELVEAGDEERGRGQAADEQRPARLGHGGTRVVVGDALGGLLGGGRGGHVFLDRDLVLGDVAGLLGRFDLYVRHGVTARASAMAVRSPLRNATNAPPAADAARRADAWRATSWNVRQSRVCPLPEQPQQGLMDAPLQVMEPPPWHTGHGSRGGIRTLISSPLPFVSWLSTPYKLA